MSTAVTLPATTGPALEPGLLPGDFYSYGGLLSDAEREVIAAMHVPAKPKKKKAAAKIPAGAIAASGAARTKASTLHS